MRERMEDVIGLRSDETLGLYVSVPFCRHKCSFCNFASGVGTGESLGRYVEQLVREIRSARAEMTALGAELPERVDTVYFGGGTPSLLEPEQIDAIFGALRQEFALEADAEMTLEAAPGQIAGATLEAAQRQGVGRVSLGVQSFVDQECAAVGRTHTAAECFAEFARLRQAGVENVGVDLIAGLPHQTQESWRYSLERLAEAGLQHASVYMLEIDEDSRLGLEVLQSGPRFGAPHVASDEASAAMYEEACAALPAAGFAQYEISNFAQAGFQSRHNLKYWKRAPYMGLGLDAHSMLPTAAGVDLRFSNTDELGTYLLGASRTTPERVGLDAAFDEAIFLGLRTVAGVRPAELRERFGARVDAVAANAEELAEAGLLEVDSERWALTLRGRVVSNDVFGRLLEAVAV